MAYKCSKKFYLMFKEPELHFLQNFEICELKSMLKCFKNNFLKIKTKVFHLLKKCLLIQKKVNMKFVVYFLLFLHDTINT